jgi:hypothetical protein
MRDRNSGRHNGRNIAIFQISTSQRIVSRMSSSGWGHQRITWYDQYGLAAVPASPNQHRISPHHDISSRDQPSSTLPPAPSLTLSLCFWDIRDTIAQVNLAHRRRDLEFRAPDVVFVIRRALNINNATRPFAHHQHLLPSTTPYVAVRRTLRCIALLISIQLSSCSTRRRSYRRRARWLGCGCRRTWRGSFLRTTSCKPVSRTVSKQSSRQIKHLWLYD